MRYVDQKLAIAGFQCCPSWPIPWPIGLTGLLGYGLLTRVRSRRSIHDPLIDLALDPAGRVRGQLPTRGKRAVDLLSPNCRTRQAGLFDHFVDS